MSATLPTALKETIESEIEEKISPLNEDLLEKLSERYKELKRIKFELRLENYLEEAVEEIVEKAKNSKVLVLCNTVEYAVKIYSMIKESGYKGKVLLLHSRFIYKKRKKKEEEIENLKKQPHILISTQVCEVSLDISYDYLFTELAPVASLVQRFGRVNRYEKETHLTNVFIFKPFLRDEKYYPYEELELEIAEKCVWEIKELKNEFQLLQKIDEVIDKQTIQKQIEKAKNELEIQTTFETPTRTGYFFSLDLSEDDVRKLIEYRENFTTLIIPFGELISDGEEALVLREKINELYKEYEKRVEKKENLLLILSQLKGFTVPVPFYSVIRANFMKIGLPLLTSVKDFIYHTEYGFVKQEIIRRIE